MAGREDPRDALVSRERTPAGGAAAGSPRRHGSLRRACQLRALRPDLEVVGIRGNVDTRLRKVEAGEVDAVVMAAAALARLGWLDRAAEILPNDAMLPAPGQGALAVEIRSDDEAARRDGGGHRRPRLPPGDDGRTRLPAPTRRRLRRPCRRAGRRWRADGCGCGGLVVDPQGSRILRGELAGPADDAEALGVRLAERLLAEGAAELLEGVAR